MKGSVKTVLFGTGVIVGLQLVLAILIKIYAASAARAQTGPLETSEMLFLGVSLGTFFVGGLFVGFVAERLRLGVPVVSGLLAMVLYSFVSMVSGLPDTMLMVAYAQEAAWGSLVMTVAIGLVTVVAGGLIGERVRMPAEDDPVARTVLVVVLALVLFGPYFFLIPYGLPWYMAVIASLVILVLVGVGYYLFTKGSTFEKSIEEISISPERQQ